MRIAYARWRTPEGVRSIHIEYMLTGRGEILIDRGARNRPHLQSPIASLIGRRLTSEDNLRQASATRRSSLSL